jgi:CheY-like chemotaxis protein
MKINPMNSINFGHKILVADDDSHNREMVGFTLKHFLGKDTVELTEVGSAQKAIEALDSGDKFDLVVTDGHMESSSPDGKVMDADGIRVIERSKKSNIPAILCSSDDRLKYAAEDLGAKILPKGDMSFIVKLGEAAKNLLKIS